MTVANLHYTYMTAPWNAPLSFGTQAFIEYNGLVMNDRYQSDRIRVTSITGLDDADSTDSREAVPGDHGEFVYDSYYRGRTFVMTGRIESGSLATLKTMERDLKAAFAPLVESPMKFRWFDVYDSFDDPQTIQNYTAVVGSSGSLSVSQGVLLWLTTSQTILMRSADNRLWGDEQATLRVILGSVTDSSSVYLVPVFKDSSDYLRVSLNIAAGSPTLKVESVSGGTVHQLSSTPITGLAQGQSIWLRSRVEGDLVTAELWTTPPTTSTFPTFSTSAWMTGSDADSFGDATLSRVGFGGQTASLNWAVDDFRVESLYPGDVSFPAKKMPGGMSIKDSQDDRNRYCRSFQITMRSSKPFAPGATQIRSTTLVPTSSNTPLAGFTAPLVAPLRAGVFVPSSVKLVNNILFVNNRGTAFSRPLVYVYGAFSNLTLVNLTNGQQINWTGTVADGDYLVFDCEKRTLVNSAGANMLGSFSSTSPVWMWLEPGWNDVYVGASSLSGNSKAVMYYVPQYL